MRLFTKLALFVVLGSLLFNCIGRKMPEDVPMAFIGSQGTYENYFEDCMSSFLNKNNINTFKSDTATTPYSLQITNSWFDVQTKNASLHLGSDCDQNTVYDEVKTHSFSLTLSLFYEGNHIKSWTFSQSKSGKLKERILTKDECDYRIKEPPSFETMLWNCARIARKKVSREVYKREFK